MIAEIHKKFSIIIMFSVLY